VYRDGESDREGELDTDTRRGTNEEFAYSAEDKDNPAAAAVAYKVRGTGVIIEFDEDDVQCLFTQINVFQLRDIRDPTQYTVDEAGLLPEVL